MTSNETITIEIDGDSKVFSEYGIGNDNTNFASLSTQKTLTLKTTTEKPFIVPATIEQVYMTSATDVTNSSINVKFNRLVKNNGQPITSGTAANNLFFIERTVGTTKIDNINTGNSNYIQIQI